MRIYDSNSPASILRLILTPKCNLQCIYCHNEGFPKSYSEFSILSKSDFKRILLRLKEKRVKSVCIAGGEPLVTDYFSDYTKIVAEVIGGKATHLTTNGIYLKRHLKTINSLNMNRINISCDAIDSNTYEKITKFNYFDNVISAVKTAIEYNLFININCVLIGGVNTSSNYLKSMIEFWEKIGVNRLSFLRLSFTSNGLDVYKYDFDHVAKILDSIGTPPKIPNYGNRPPSIRYKYNDLEIALRCYAPNMTNEPCKDCHKRSICSEGFYHPRLGLNGILRACILREDISLDLTIPASLDKPLDDFLEMYQSIPETWEKVSIDRA